MNRDETRLAEAQEKAFALIDRIRNLPCKCGHEFWLHQPSSGHPAFPGCVSLLDPVTRQPMASYCACSGFVPITPEDLEVALAG